ncbi:enoyl-CoA hydratase [Eubacterium pyruvativorans]|jgi:enoyl-CoA hydratase|uniref:short-chain-enoyl-CoA hydratase n=1 Tax=Eubacterium pyruvativorans TaxID=155865 RepID=A0A1I7GQT8_9FIRM|nr:enoyl-CoA hydratase-related protein [Eubacterium pyruvativorans]MDD6707565.1 enoyl-CoA hydratase-related protein [Eubacterium pyruvativorans]SFO11393.1 enoyl-CoA hydratase [Eubacterium pyruvativorans]SFU50606.1 enoyl-CoA hydratase [Eubacterium pyruvativorans]HAT83187.1 crotonase [Eubacterium sp.]
MYENILYEVKDHVGYLTINRPKALNALCTAVLEEIDDCLDTKIAPDNDVHVVVVTGAGRAFVAGADISEMQTKPVLEGHDYTELGHKVMDKIDNSPKVFIAAVNGFALGGGCELSMACDIRIASEKALFGQPEVGLGITPGFGGTQRLPRLVGKGMAKYMILAAKNVKADEALRIGLVQQVVPAEELMPTVEKLAKSIAAKAPIAVQQSKMAINNGMNTDLRTGCRLEIEGFQQCFASEDRVEGMSAFVEKRDPVFQNK